VCERRRKVRKCVVSVWECCVCRVFEKVVECLRVFEGVVGCCFRVR
jgi:hypothetical protein